MQLTKLKGNNWRISKENAQDTTAFYQLQIKKGKKWEMIGERSSLEETLFLFVTTPEFIRVQASISLELVLPLPLFCNTVVRGDKWRIGFFPQYGRFIYFVQSREKASVSWSSQNGAEVISAHTALEDAMFSLTKYLETVV